MFVNLLYLDNFNINVGAIYYPVPDFNNPPVVYPTDDYYYGSSATKEPTNSPTGGPTSEPTGQPTFSPSSPSGQPSANPTSPTSKPTAHVRRNLMVDSFDASPDAYAAGKLLILSFAFVAFSNYS